MLHRVFSLKITPSLLWIGSMIGIFRNATNKLIMIGQGLTSKSFNNFGLSLRMLRRTNYLPPVSKMLVSKAWLQSKQEISARKSFRANLENSATILQDIWSSRHASGFQNGSLVFPVRLTYTKLARSWGGITVSRFITCYQIQRQYLKWFQKVISRAFKICFPQDKHHHLFETRMA